MNKHLAQNCILKISLIYYFIYICKVFQSVFRIFKIMFLKFLHCSMRKDVQFPQEITESSELISDGLVWIFFLLLFSNTEFLVQYEKNTPKNRQ